MGEIYALFGARHIAQDMKKSYNTDIVGVGPQDPPIFTPLLPPGGAQGEKSVIFGHFCPILTEVPTVNVDALTYSLSWKNPFLEEMLRTYMAPIPESLVALAQTIC